MHPVVGTGQGSRRIGWRSGAGRVRWSVQVRGRTGWAGGRAPDAWGGRYGSGAAHDRLAV